MRISSNSEIGDADEVYFLGKSVIFMSINRAPQIKKKNKIAA